MQEYRDGNDRLRPSWTSPLGRSGHHQSASRFEEVGDLHFHAAAFSSAVEYYRSAMRALTQTPTAGTAAGESLRLRRKLADCYRHQGLLQEASHELDRCLSLVPEGSGVDRARLDVRVAKVRQQQGRYQDAIDLALGAFAVLAATDLHRDVAGAQMVLGICHANLGNTIKAEEFFQDALGTYRRIDDRLSQGQVLVNLAILAKRACRWNRALQLYERAETFFRRNGATHQICLLHVNRAILFRKMGRRAEAMASAERGMHLARNLGDQGRTMRLNLLLGQLMIDQGSLADAERHLLEAKVLAERQEAQRELALADEYLGDLMRAAGRLHEAEMNYVLAEDRAREISASDVLAEVARRRAELALERAEPESALLLAKKGLELVEVCGEEFERGFLYRVCSQVERERGEFEASIEYSERALEVFRSLRLPHEMGSGLRELAELHLLRGTEQERRVARSRLHEALEVEGIDGCTPGICRTQLLLAQVEFALGNHDEALLALFEIERVCGQQSSGLEKQVEELRRQIECGLSQDAVDRVGGYQLLSELPESGRDENDNASGTLEAVLDAITERLRAQRALVAVRGPRGGVQLLAARKLGSSEGRQLAQFTLELLAGSSDSGPRVWSKVDTDPKWSPLLEKGIRPEGAVVAFRVAESAHGPEGLFYFESASGSRGELGFDREALAVASTHVDLFGTGLLDGNGTARRSVSELVAREPFARVLTRSECMAEVLLLCEKVADSPYTVLFTGETGTGKGLLARLIHDLSPRASRRFVSVNCAALPEGLLESELFGHVRGSFTGAERDQEGLILSARRGTLFLDEVGKMSLPMQAKLLHFLDTKEVRPVGGTKTQVADVRVLCATKHDLRAMVEREEFLEDLYYRLLDFPVEVPPLRERGDDVLVLAAHFIRRTAEELGRPVPRMMRGFALRLGAHRWPGNVRELEKTIKRAVILTGGQDRLGEAQLPEAFRLGADEPTAEALDGDLRPLKPQVAELERRVIEAALARLGWNRAEVARQLRISYPTLLQKIRSYGLRPD